MYFEIKMSLLNIPKWGRVRVNLLWKINLIFLLSNGPVSDYVGIFVGYEVGSHQLIFDSHWSQP